MNFDKNFWEDTYQRNIGKLIGLCYRYVGNKEISEDIAHNSFLTAMEKSDSYKSLGHFDAWLRKITLNNALQHLKNEKKVAEKKKNIILDGINDEDEKTTQKFTLHQLLSAINQLPEHHKTVFNLYVIDEYSHKEIAQTLNISEGTSKSHLSRAKRKLREILNKEKKNRYFMLFVLPCGRRKTKKKLKNFLISTNAKDIFSEINYTIYKTPKIGSSKASIIFKIGLPLLIISSLVYIFNKNNNPTMLEETENKSIEDIAFDTDSIKNEEPVIIKKQIIVRKTITDTIKITNE